MERALERCVNPNTKSDLLCWQRRINRPRTASVLIFHLLLLHLIMSESLLIITTLHYVCLLLHVFLRLFLTPCPKLLRFTVLVRPLRFCDNVPPWVSLPAPRYNIRALVFLQCQLVGERGVKLRICAKNSRVEHKPFKDSDHNRWDLGDGVPLKLRLEVPRIEGLVSRLMSVLTSNEGSDTLGQKARAPLTL